MNYYKILLPFIVLYYSCSNLNSSAKNYTIDASLKLCDSTYLNIKERDHNFIAYFLVNGKLNGPFLNARKYGLHVNYTRFYLNDTIVSEKRYYRNNLSQGLDSIVYYRSYQKDSVNFYYPLFNNIHSCFINIKISNLINDNSSCYYRVYTPKFDRRELVYTNFILHNDSLSNIMNTTGNSFQEIITFECSNNACVNKESIYLNLMQKKSNELDSSTYLMNITPILLFYIRIDNINHKHRKINSIISKINW